MLNRIVPEDALKTFKKAIHIPDFRRLVISRACVAMALTAQAVAVGWHIYELSRDPLLLGLVGLAEAIPAIGFAFVAGHTVDTHRPASVLRLSISCLFLNSLLIWSTTFLPFPPSVLLIMLFLGVFFSGMCRAFSGPSVFALISHVVPRAMLAEASAYSSWAFQVSAIIGPALAGLLYGYVGAVVTFSILPLLMCIAVLVQLRFSPKTKTHMNDSVREPFLKSIRSGIQFVRQEKVLLSAMSLDMFSVLFGGAVAILPMFSDQVLQAGSTGLGLLRASPSVGSAAIAIFLSLKPLRVIRGRMLLYVVAGFGICTLAFAFSRDLYLCMFFLALSGMFDGISMVIRNTILQLLTPQSMRGRVSSLSLVFISSSNEIGAFESGVAARVLGLVPSVLFGGGMNLLVVLLTAWLSPELTQTRIDSGHDT